MRFDLYRLFFPIGWLIGLWGALVWVFHYFNLMEYPSFIHPDIMMGGFILSFVVGFLTTAAPKFTNSFPPTKKEMWAACFLSFLLFICQFFNKELYSRVASLFVLIFLARFLVRRFFKRTSNPPAPFLFVGVGVGIAILGNSLLLLSSLNLIGDKLTSFGRLLFFQAHILSLILGVGSRLVPSLLGHAPPPDQRGKERLNVKTYAILAAFFLGSYIIEGFINKTAGQVLKDAMVAFIGLFVWKLYLLPKRKALQAYGLWISAIFCVCGLVAASFSEAFYVHYIHLFYISGLSLMTIMIATRVSLSHGNHNMQIEVNSKAIFSVIVLFLIAAVLRVGSIYVPDLMLKVLFIAASIWTLGMLIWGAVFLPRIIKIHLK